MRLLSRLVFDDESDICFMVILSTSVIHGSLCNWSYGHCKKCAYIYIHSECVPLFWTYVSTYSEAKPVNVQPTGTGVERNHGAAQLTNFNISKRIHCRIVKAMNDLFYDLQSTF